MTTRTKPPAVITPKQSTDNLYRGFRGGAWDYSTAANVCAAYLFGSTPTLRDYLIGFRCAQRGCRQPLKGDAL